MQGVYQEVLGISPGAGKEEGRMGRGRSQVGMQPIDSWLTPWGALELSWTMLRSPGLDLWQYTNLSSDIGFPRRCMTLTEMTCIPDNTTLATEKTVLRWRSIWAAHHCPALCSLWPTPATYFLLKQHSFLIPLEAQSGYQCYEKSFMNRVCIYQLKHQTFSA